MSLFDVRYQPLAHSLLQRAVRCGRIPHAYVFVGPDGVGRKMLGLRFAGLLLCAQPREAGAAPPEYADVAGDWIDMCGTCSNCELMARDAHPDCHVIYRQLSKFHSDTQVRERKATRLGIPVIRHFVIEAAARKASAQARKVFLIEEAELMTLEAQNALLKTLEEPPPDTYIILLTTRLNALLPTTRSRAQLLQFRPLPCEFVAQRLQAANPDLDDAAVQFLAHHEPGSLGRALRLAEDGYPECNREIVGELLQLRQAESLKVAKRIDDHAQELGKKMKARQPESSDSDVHRRGLGMVLGLVATFYRDVLRLACGRDQGLCNGAIAEGLERLARHCGPLGAARAIDLVGQAQRDTLANANGMLCLEGLLIHLARLHGAPQKA